ncbi:hypothetical protein [Leptospira wolffii]|uniref:hypothetical protein n=1 Tax=Leptospira wolffii TaxID=409998 RepID=UPI0002D7ADB2|nr:hypothetical protein [Leptospira wolffii]EPG67734.1 hypothetical protein LEP1GSC061_0777 [Leptospira wolffii serovar Khorat str. Khorat-H2]
MFPVKKRSFYLPILCFLFLFEGCLFPDRDRQSLSFHPDSVRENELDVIHTYEVREEGLSGSIYLMKSDSNLVELFLSNIVVDNSKSAMMHLSPKYLVALAVVENTSEETKILSYHKLNLSLENRTLIPLEPKDYPKEIRCFNWKGTAKNFYNFIAISVVAVYTVNAMFGCLEGKCDAIRDLQKETETHPPFLNDGSYFSDLNFTTALDFRNGESEGFLIQPKTVAKGVFLYRNPKGFSETKEFLTKGNCEIR